MGGTRQWSQEVDEAARDRVNGENLAYTIHFYANTHRQGLRDKVSAALASGVAVFATEWGTCDASGGGTLDLGETQAWLNFFAQHHISDANWAVSDKSEACSALLLVTRVAVASGVTTVAIVATMVQGGV